MHRIDTIPAFDFANERRGDVFTLEFPNRWDARAARRAAELDPAAAKPSSMGRRVLARATALGRGSHAETSR